MRTCPKVWGIAAHCVRLCPSNGETTAGLTELTIICNNNMYCTLLTGALLKQTKNREHKSTVSSFHIYATFRKYSNLES